VLKREGPKQGPTSGGVSMEGMWRRVRAKFASGLG